VALRADPIKQRRRDAMRRPIRDDDFNPDGTLKDGHSMRVPVRMIDAVPSAHAPRARVVDAAGNGDRLSLSRLGARRIADTSPYAAEMRAARDAAYRAYLDDLTTAYKNPSSSGAFSRGEQPGDHCTVDGRAGHLQRRNGQLVCVPDQRRDAANGDDEDDLDGKCQKIAAALKARGHEDEDIDDFLGDLDDDTIGENNIGAHVKEFEKRQRRSVADAERRRQAATEVEYRRYADEISQA
jgi:hypothetical protein